MNQLRWVFRLKCYKTAPRWVQPRIPLCVHSASSTAPHQANTNAASSERYMRSSVRTGRCTRHREHPGWAWLGTKQPAWGLRGCGGRSTRPPRCCRLAHHQVRSTSGFLHLKATRKTHAATARNYGRTSLSIRPVVPVHATSKCGGLQGSAPHGHHAAAAFHTIRSV